MALDDNAVMVPGKGYFYVAPLGTTMPTGSTPADPWINVGHTSRDEPLTISREGGDRTTLGSWQNEALRERVEPVSYRLAFRCLQYDSLALSLFYGGGSVDATTNRFQVPKTPTPQEYALYVVIVDGGNTWDRHFPKSGILGNDDEEFDVEQLAGMPVSATILGDSSLEHLFTLAGPGIEAPATTTA